MSMINALAAYTNSNGVPSETPQTDNCERGVHTFIAAVIDGESRYCSNCETEEDDFNPAK
jgi:hypothetical protein